MNAKQRKTLRAVFAEPVSRSIAWGDIETLFISAGAKLIPGSGSRIRFVKDDHVATFHRPHGQKEAKPYQVKQARAFLTQLEVKP